jgi:hypothetical protein
VRSVPAIDWEPARQALANRNVILLGRPADQLRGTAQWLCETLGSPILLVANQHEQETRAGGTSTVSIPLGYTNSTGLFQLLHELLRHPPQPLAAALRTFDPDGTAVVIADSNTVVPSLAGRPVLDARAVATAALEFPGDAIGVWRAAGLMAAPAGLLLSPFNDVATAVADVSLGAGTLCFGDMRSCLQEALESVRGVKQGEDPLAASDWLHLSSDRAQVQAVIGGLCATGPGMVLGEQVITLLPQEEALVTDPRSGKVWLAGCATLASGSGQAAVAGAARRVGEVLRDNYGFQGSFSVSGWLRGETFTPSRLTTRTTRSHRHAMGASVGSAWVLMNALATGSVLDSRQLRETGFAEAVASAERQAISLGLVTTCSPKSAIVGRWLERTGSGKLVSSPVRTPSCLVWSASQDGGVIGGVDLSNLQLPGHSFREFIGELLGIFAQSWPEAGIQALRFLPDWSEVAR